MDYFGWLRLIDWLIDWFCKIMFFDMMLKYICSWSLFNTLYVEKKQINFFFKIYCFLLLRAPNHNSFTFNLWLLCELKHKVNLLKVQVLWVGFFIFGSLLLLLKFIYFFSVKTMWDHQKKKKKKKKKKSWEYVKNEKFVMKIFSPVILSEVLKSCKKWYIYICWCKS